MKKFIYSIGIIILVLSLAIGCTNDEGNQEDLDKDQGNAEEELDNNEEDERTVEEIMNDFEDTIENSVSDVGDFIEKNMENLSAIEVDAMVSKLINKTEEEINMIKQKIEELDVDNELINAFNGELYLTEEQIKDLKNDKLRQELEKIKSENYRLMNSEGEYYPIVNYEGFKKYDEYISSELEEYINLKARDANKPVALDAGLYISYDELADRIVETENYIKKYGEGDRYSEVLNLYRNKLTLYLLGTDNTPMTETSSKKIKEELMNSYKETALIKDSLTGFIVGKYINLIDENLGIIDEEIRSEALMLVEEATELIGTGK